MKITTCARMIGNSSQSCYWNEGYNKEQRNNQQVQRAGPEELQVVKIHQNLFFPGLSLCDLSPTKISKKQVVN